MTIYRARRELLRLASAVFEATWYFVTWRLVFALFAANEPFPSYPMVLGLTIFAVFVARYLDLGKPGDTAQGWAIAVAAGITLFVAASLMGLGGPLAFLTGLRDFKDPNVLLTIGHLILWWRAISLVGEGFSVERTGFRFRIGVVALFWTLLGIALTGLDMTPYIFIFFTASLVAMALSRVEEVSRDVAGVATPFDRTWVTILLIAVLSVMVLGLIATSVLTPDMVRAIMGLFGPIWNIIAGILIWLIYITILLLSPLIEALGNFLRPALANLPRLPQPAATPEPQELIEKAPLLPPYVTDALRWVGLLALLFGALWLISVWAQRRRQSLLEPIPELRESVWSLDAFAQDARNLLDRALDRFRGKGRTHSTETIRRIYASLQALAAEWDAPRPPDDTPYEYLPSLIAVFPAAETDLRFLTQAYVDAHYHELPTSAADLARARAAWDRIQTIAAHTEKKEKIKD